MKKHINVGLKVVLSLILLMPVLGVLGIFPPPTPDMYQTNEAYRFIVLLSELGFYINYALAATCAIGLILLWTGRVALAALIILPVTVNVIGFHLFLDGGLLTVGASLGNVMAIINAYFIYENMNKYQPMLKQTA